MKIYRSERCKYYYETYFLMGDILKMAWLYANTGEWEFCNDNPKAVKQAFDERIVNVNTPVEIPLSDVPDIVIKRMLTAKEYFELRKCLKV
jgi:hypothetical protein